MPRLVAVDTGPLVALFDQHDSDHAQAQAFFSSWQDEGVVTTAVIAEAAHLLGYHPQAPLNFLRWVQRGALQVEEVSSDLERVIDLMAKYADVPMDFADATIVAACERRSIRHVATLDSDFVVYRLHGRQAFDNVFPM